MLSSERTFALPVGSQLGADGELGGYYVDFSVKAETPNWPPPWFDSFEETIHVATIQWGLGAYERYLAGEGEAWLEAAREACDYLLEHQETGPGPHHGGWVHRIPMPHTYRLEPPWLSAMAQGEGVSLLARLHAATGEARFLEAAHAALKPLAIPTEEGGVRAELDGGFFLEEYPTTPHSLVLNGGIFALWGYRDAAEALGDDDARASFDEGVDTLARNLDRWDTGSWSLYDLFPHPIANVASSAYHLLHLTQLRAMQGVAPRPQFASMVERWEGYRSRRGNRARAFAHKVGFRLILPRNPLFAQRTPFLRAPG
jgi:heparosan-N-sulfate-glucuronate 5-epimerase